MRRVETWIVLLAVAFYAWLLHRFGISRILDYVRIAGWGLAATTALESVARFANTLGWRVTISRYPRGLSLGELFVARIAGEAVDYVTPSAQLGGQFVMALMVRRKLALALGLATVIAASLAEAVGQIGFISASLLLSLPRATGLHDLFWPIVAGFIIALGLIGGFLFVQLKQPFSHLWKLAAKLEIPQLANPEVRRAAGEADALLLNFYAQHRVRFALSCFCYLIAWSMGPVEIAIYLTLLHQHFGWTAPLLIEALGLLIERATFLIPGKLVSQEGGKALIMSLLGYPAGVGFAIGLLRRIKELVWVLIGLLGLMLHRVWIGQTMDPRSRSTGSPLKMREAQEGEGS